MFEKKFSFILFLILVIILYSLSVSAGIGIGGEIETGLISLIDEEGVLSAKLQENIKLELLVPRKGNTDIKFKLNVYNNPLLNDAYNININKLYIKHYFDDFQLTVGRQPISWSFGSLLNPVNFNSGAVVMDEETGSKYLNAVEAYIPYNWNTGLSLIAAYPEYTNGTKWGVRARTEILAYDFSLNYVKEAEKNIEGLIIPGGTRLGITTKGDLGPLGVYAAVAYNLLDESEEWTNIYLLGGDYSYLLEYGNKVYIQLEYINLAENELANILGPSLPANLTGDSSRIGLLMSSLNYEIDDFSQIGLMSISSVEDGSMILIPVYQNYLGDNLSLTIRGALYNGVEGRLFAPIQYPGEENKIQGLFEMSLNYPF